jgi:hypothetical protein
MKVQVEDIPYSGNEMLHKLVLVVSQQERALSYSFDREKAKLEYVFS